MHTIAEAWLAREGGSGGLAPDSAHRPLHAYAVAARTLGLALRPPTNRVYEATKGGRRDTVPDGGGKRVMIAPSHYAWGTRCAQVSIGELRHQPARPWRSLALPISVRCGRPRPRPTKQEVAPRASHAARRAPGSVGGDAVEPTITLGQQARRCNRGP